MLQPLTSDLLCHEYISHGFFTRKGGVSHGRSELDCGLNSNDDTDHIATNRALVAQHLGGSLEGVSQYHSATVITLTESLHEIQPPADAMVTNVPGLALSILTADCGPVLFVDAKARVIGAAHSGWRGTVHCVAAKTVQAMELLGADANNICAVLGPTIAQKSYEVGPEFPENLKGATAEPMQYLIPSSRAGHWMLDLPGLIGDQLHALVGHSCTLNADTYTLADQFYSHRRSTHAGQSNNSRQISGICLNG